MDAPHTPHVPHETDRRRRVWLGVLVLVWGVQAIVTQSLLLREALVLMFGSEFAWGVVLFAWLFGVAVGGAFGGWVAERLPRAPGRPGLPGAALVAVLLALSVAACVELWVFRGARSWLGVEPGELLPLTKTALAALLFVSPTSALVGLAFPLACCVTVTHNGSGRGVGESPRAAIRGHLSLGSVYALESAGGLIGGAVFSFWAVEHLAPIQTALICGALTAAASAGFLSARRKKCIPFFRSGAACLVAAAAAALLLSIIAGDALDRRLIDRRWRNVAPGYQLIDEVESKYQNLAIGRRAEQFTLYSDGQVSADFPDPYTFVPLAHFWLCQHPAPRNVLVLGGGAEGLLAEILRHPVKHVDYVEPDPRQIELIEPYLAVADRQALTDDRVTVHHLDARYFVKGRLSQFDLVIARLPEPMSALRARLYTDEFYGELRRAMRPRSVLCMTASATPGKLSAASAEYLASIRATLRPHFPHITIGWGNPAQVLAATEEGLVSTDPRELAARYSQRGVESELFHPAWFDGAMDWLDPGKLQQRARELDAADNVETSTDLHPIIYLQRLLLWERMTGGRSTRVIERLRSVGWPELVVALLATAGVALFACYVRARLKGRAGRGTRPAATFTPKGRCRCAPPALPADGSWVSNGAIILSIGSTGFATMALSIIWLFAFQNLYGYVYQRIGWIIAVFMGGLVIGCWLATWRSKRAGVADSLPARGHPESWSPGTDGQAASGTPPTAGATLTRYLWRRLVVVDVLLALLALAVPFVLSALGSLQGGESSFALVEWCVSIMVAVTGVLGGAAFPLAGSLQLEATGRTGAAAGSIIGADHAGACAGALFCGILLVPVFGTAAAAFLLAGIKLSSAALLAAAGTVRR